MNAKLSLLVKLWSPAVGQQRDSLHKGRQGSKLMAQDFTKWFGQ